MGSRQRFANPRDRQRGAIAWRQRFRKGRSPRELWVIFLGSKRSSHFGTRHWHGRMNFLCLQVCLGKTAQETLLGSVYLPDLLQRRLKSGCLATADGEAMQVG